MLDLIKRIPLDSFVKIAVFVGISIAVYVSYSHKEELKGIEQEMKVFEKEQEVILEQLKDLNVTKINLTTGSVHTIEF